MRIPEKPSPQSPLNFLGKRREPHLILTDSPCYSWHSEPEDRSERDSQVVMRPTAEVDLVSGFKAQAQSADRGRDAGVGIESGVQVGSAESEDRTRHVAVRKQARAQTEIGKSLSTWRRDVGDQQSAAPCDQ